MIPDPTPDDLKQDAEVRTLHDPACHFWLYHYEGHCTCGLRWESQLAHERRRADAAESARDELQSVQRESEAAHKCLDERDVPRRADDNSLLTLWGRVAAWKRMETVVAEKQRDELQSEVQRLKADYKGGDTEAQAMAWSAVYQACSRLGMVPWMEAKDKLNGRERVIAFIENLTNQRDELQKRLAELKELLTPVFIGTLMVKCQDSSVANTLAKASVAIYGEWIVIHGEGVQGK